VRILLAVNGPSSHLFPLPHGWADHGHAVDILMDAVDGRFGPASRHVHPGVRLLHFSRRQSVLNAVSGEQTETTLSELLESADAVVIGGYATRVARRILRAPARKDARRVLLAERPSPHSSPSRRMLRDLWARWALSRVDAVWSMSEVGDRAFTRLGRPPEARVPYPMRPIAWGEPGFADKVAATWQNGGPLRMIFVGKLIERKRPLAAVEVVRLLSGGDIEVAADIAGAGDLEPEVRAAARGLPIALHGNIPPSAVSKLLAQSNLLLHPASHDGWGMAVIEAASQGVPVVATTGCDAATELASRTNWVRVTDGSPAAMSQAAAELFGAFRKDPMHNAVELIRAVDEVCGVDRIVERSLAALGTGGVEVG
jgi:glycosyltransferase involved in cell wall biosynthesis